jgi:hypothetical protein
VSAVATRLGRYSLAHLMLSVSLFIAVLLLLQLT